MTQLSWDRSSESIFIESDVLVAVAEDDCGRNRRTTLVDIVAYISNADRNNNIAAVSSFC